MHSFFSVAFIGFGFVVGCSSADTSAKGADGGAPGDDGKLHPAPNGMPIASADACKALNDAISSSENTFNPFCGVTNTVCPGGDGLSCKNFDDGTVTGCMQYYHSAPTCVDLRLYAVGCAVACKD